VTRRDEENSANVHQLGVRFVRPHSSSGATSPSPRPNSTGPSVSAVQCWSMIIYEVTADVPAAAIARYEAFMRDQHIPDVLATGCFDSATIAGSIPGRYRIRYRTRSLDTLDHYSLARQSRFLVRSGPSFSIGTAPSAARPDASCAIREITAFVHRLAFPCPHTCASYALSNCRRLCAAQRRNHILDCSASGASATDTCNWYFTTSQWCTRHKSGHRKISTRELRRRAGGSDHRTHRTLPSTH
jgi:Domain of unknown function (DUF4286)